jgi:hypothetical protein
MKEAASSHTLTHSLTTLHLLVEVTKEGALLVTHLLVSAILANIDYN